MTYSKLVKYELADVLRENYESISWKCTGCDGDLNKYFGQRVTFQASKSPSCGPGQQRDHFYQSAATDPKVDVAVHGAINSLVEGAFAFASRADTVMYNLMPKHNGLTRHGRMAILTLNFGNTEHNDYFDAFSKEHLETIEESFDQFHAGGATETQLKNYIDQYYKLFGMRVVSDTTCGYQFLRKVESDILFHQHFLLNSLGIAVKLIHCCTIHFYASLILHSTSVPLLEHPSGEIQVSSHKNGHIVFAWGGGGARYGRFKQRMNGEHWTNF